MKYFLAILTTFVFVGCVQDKATPSAPKTIYIKRKCPQFNASIAIKVEELNSTHGAVSWVDISQVESLIVEKKKFNTKVRTMNN